MPRLACTTSRTPPTENDLPSTDSRYVATSSATDRSGMSGSSTANSSPPSRATVAPFGPRLLEPVGDLADQLVADLVAEGVVDLLEVVEVDHHDRQRLAGPLGLLESA